MGDLHKKNEITFKMNLQGIESYSELSDTVFEFFDDIKVEVHERFLESQKKYFKIEDNFYLVPRDDTRSFFNSLVTLIDNDVLGELDNGILEEVDYGKLNDELREHYENIDSKAWSSSEISVSHGNIPLKDFDKHYDYLTRQFYYDALRFCKDKLIICFIEYKFVFTNFCDCDDIYNEDGCGC